MIKWLFGMENRVELEFPNANALQTFKNMVPLSHPSLTCVSVSGKNGLTNTRMNMPRQSKNV